MTDPGAIVHLNVGGRKFSTQLATLRTHRGSHLYSIFSSPIALPRDSSDGSFFIDRNGEMFDLILDYLRCGSLVIPRDPTRYAILRREVLFYGLPIALKLPPAQPLSWTPAPVRYKHTRIVIDEVDKSIESQEGHLPSDLHTRQLSEIVRFFGGLGYKLVSEYTSRGTRGFSSVWMTKKEVYPGADIGVEVTDAEAPLHELAQAAPSTGTAKMAPLRSDGGSMGPYNGTMATTTSGSPSRAARPPLRPPLDVDSSTGS